MFCAGLFSICRSPTFFLGDWMQFNSRCGYKSAGAAPEAPEAPVPAMAQQNMPLPTFSTVEPLSPALKGWKSALQPTFAPGKAHSALRRNYRTVPKKILFPAANLPPPGRRVPQVSPGAPGLVFETWESTNPHLRRGTPHSPRLVTWSGEKRAQSAAESCLNRPAGAHR